MGYRKSSTCKARATGDARMEYDTLECALDGARHAKRAYGHDVTPYRCVHCRKWHIAPSSPSASSSSAPAGRGGRASGPKVGGPATGSVTEARPTGMSAAKRKKQPAATRPLALPSPATDRTKYCLRLTYLDHRLHAELRIREVGQSRTRIPGGSLARTPELAHAPAHRGSKLVREVQRAQSIAAALNFDQWEPSTVEPLTWTTDDWACADQLLAASVGIAVAGLEVEWQSPRRAVRRTLGVDHLSIRSAVRKQDWFDLEGGCASGDVKVSLVDLVRAVRSGAKYVEVGPDTYAKLSDELRSLFLEWPHLKADGAGLTAHASMLKALQGAAHVMVGPLQKVLEGLPKAERGEVVLSPACSRLTLKPYQQEGAKWLIRQARWAPGACLADDMGLGKTRQILALLLQRAGLGPALVVAPASVCTNWLTGDGALVAGFLNVIPATLRKVGYAAVVVASYDYAARHAKELTQSKWATIVYDEAQYLKNAESKRARELSQLEAPFVVAVTGTPIENNAAELWSISRFFFPGLLGTGQEFERKFAGPIRQGGDARSKATVHLTELLRPVVLRRTRAEQLKELPPLQELVETVELPVAERKVYEAKRQLAEEQVLEAVASLPEGEKRIRSIELLRQLREVAAAPGIHDEQLGHNTAKIQRLVELVNENRAAGHRVLVFSQWTRVLDLVQRALAVSTVAVGRLDGSTNGQIVALDPDQPEWRKGRRRIAPGSGAMVALGLDVLLISLTSGSLGINLQDASYVYLFDPWWNPQRELQAICRAHRTGQQRPVTAVRLIAADTVEGKLLALQADKRELFDQLMGGEYKGNEVTMDEIMKLLS